MTSTNSSGTPPLHIGLRAAVETVESFAGWITDGHYTLAKQEADAAANLLSSLPGVVEPVEVHHLTALLSSGEANQIGTAYMALLGSTAVLQGLLAYVEMERILGFEGPVELSRLPAVRFMTPAPDKSPPDAHRASLKGLTDVTLDRLQRWHRVCLPQEADEERAFVIFRDHTDSIGATPSVEELLSFLKNSPMQICREETAIVYGVLMGEVGDVDTDVTPFLGIRSRVKRFIASGEAARFCILERERLKHAATYPSRATAFSILEDTQAEIKNSLNRDELQEALEGSLIDDGPELWRSMLYFLKTGEYWSIQGITRDLGLRDKAFELREDPTDVLEELRLYLPLLSLLPDSEGENLKDVAQRTHRHIQSYWEKHAILEFNHLGTLKDLHSVRNAVKNLSEKMKTEPLDKDFVSAIDDQVKGELSLVNGYLTALNYYLSQRKNLTMALKWKAVDATTAERKRSDLRAFQRHLLQLGSKINERRFAPESRARRMARKAAQWLRALL